MEMKKVLTRFPQGDVGRVSLEDLLCDAGLELWQAPEGFWAVRLKGAAPTNVEPHTRDPRARRAAR